MKPIAPTLPEVFRYIAHAMQEMHTCGRDPPHPRKSQPPTGGCTPSRVTVTYRPGVSERRLRGYFMAEELRHIWLWRRRILAVDGAPRVVQEAVRLPQVCLGRAGAGAVPPPRGRAM